MVRRTLIQKRRVIETSSGFSSSATIAVRGSSAIPQIGHEPGSARTISGCIGHVYSIRVAETIGTDGSSAIPHFGHAPEWSCCTSGSIGQMYAVIASIVSMIVFKVKAGNWDPGMMCNGFLAGLVAITASCAFVTPIGAALIGVVAGTLVVYSSIIVEKMGVDDVAGAISVHGTCGAWGVLSVGLFACGEYGAGYNGVATPVIGFFYGGGVGQLLMQIIDVTALVTWAFVVM